jgi:hypothetical protein
MSLIQWIIYHSDLYDSQFLIFLKGQEKLNMIIENEYFLRK